MVWLRWSILAVACSLFVARQLEAQVAEPSFWTRGSQPEPLYRPLSRALKGVSLSSDAPRLRLAVVEMGRGQLPEDPRASILLFRYKRENYSPLRDKEYSLLEQIAQAHEVSLRSDGVYRFFEAEASIYWLKRNDFIKAQPFLLSLAHSERRAFSLRARMFLAIQEFTTENVFSPWLDAACLEGSRGLAGRSAMLFKVHPAPKPTNKPGIRVEQARCALLFLFELKQRREFLAEAEFQQEFARLYERARALISRRHNVAALSLFSEHEWPTRWRRQLQQLEQEVETHAHQESSPSSSVAQGAEFNALDE